MCGVPGGASKLSANIIKLQAGDAASPGQSDCQVPRMLHSPDLQRA